MRVYVVVEEAQYDYSNGEWYKNVHGVYLLESSAQAAVKECEAQTGGKYYASIETHEVE